MTILYFGSYSPDYARNWVLINGLKANGAEVLKCNNQLKGRLARFLGLFLRYWKFRGKYDVMIVGFPGQEIMFLARLLRPFGIIIFDAFTSHYGGYILDRKRADTNSVKAKYYRFLDTYSCKLADLVLLDTNAHIDFFVNEFKLPREQFRRIWIGANDVIFQPINRQDPLKQVLPVNSEEKFKVLFFGTYVPLQGSEYIVRAAKIISDKDRNIKFKFIGKGQDENKVKNLAKELGVGNIEFINMLPLEELKKEIVQADISLGLFGDTPKTPLVIPNKVYESLAMRKPVITADTKAIREFFNENDMYLVKPADPESLARAIIELKNNPELRNKLAENGYKKFKENASYKILGSELLKILIEVKKA